MSPLRFRIRELRTAAGLSQEQLAAKASTNQATISGLESGKNKRLDLDVLDRVARALGVTPTELIAEFERTFTVNGRSYLVRPNPSHGSVPGAKRVPTPQLWEVVTCPGERHVGTFPVVGPGDLDDEAAIEARIGRLVHKSKRKQ